VFDLNSKHHLATGSSQRLRLSGAKEKQEDFNDGIRQVLEIEAKIAIRGLDGFCFGDAVNLRVVRSLCFVCSLSLVLFPFINDSPPVKNSFYTATSILSEAKNIVG
jgi:hypothetical protein